MFWCHLIAYWFTLVLQYTCFHVLWIHIHIIDHNSMPIESKICTYIYFAVYTQCHKAVCTEFATLMWFAGIWKVLRGNCTVEGSCILSPNYPSNYSTSDFCVILVNSSLVGPLETITWDVEWWYDYLKINDKLFNGRLQPDGIIPNGSIHWVSDDNNTGSGWKICSGNASKETDSWPNVGEVVFKSYDVLWLSLWCVHMTDGKVTVRLLRYCLTYIISYDFEWVQIISNLLIIWN